jgi:hypothetical protein
MDRRDFLKTLGIGVAAGIIGIPPGRSVAEVVKATEEGRVYTAYYYKGSWHRLNKPISILKFKLNMGVDEPGFYKAMEWLMSRGEASKSKDVVEGPPSGTLTMYVDGSRNKSYKKSLRTSYGLNMGNQIKMHKDPVSGFCLFMFTEDD